MRHAVLGAGGVGILIAGELAAAGNAVVLLLRGESYSSHPRQVNVVRLGRRTTATVDLATSLVESVDVLWVAVKATQLPDALETSSCGQHPVGLVVPLLNGIDHVAFLRQRFGSQGVVPATISVEVERLAPGYAVQHSPTAVMRLSAKGQGELQWVASQLTGAGITCEFWQDEVSMLWSKLAYLAPFALVTSATGQPLGEILQEAHWRMMLEHAVQEAAAVASAAGAHIEAEVVVRGILALPGAARSSMQKDMAAGRLTELDAIGGPIVRGGDKHAIDVSTTRQLMELIHTQVADLRHQC